jgi:hypothetical protein
MAGSRGRGKRRRLTRAQALADNRRMKTSSISIVLAGTLAACSTGQAQEAGPDLTDAMVFESAAGCRFDPLTEHALDGVLLGNYGTRRMSHAPRVFVGPLELVPQVEREEDSDDYPGIVHTGRAAFPTGTRWHGLTPQALHSYYFAPPETDHYEDRGILFADSPQRLHDALAAMGQAVPMAPESLELTDFGPFFGAGCGSSIEIRAEGQGSALVCGYGC